MNIQLAKVIRKDSIEGMRSSLMAAGVMLGVPFGLGLWLGIFNTACEFGMLAIYILCSWFVWCYMLSSLFAKLKTKEGRIAMLMSPAPAISTYIIRLLIGFVCIPMLIYAGYWMLWLADSLTIHTIYGYWPNNAIFHLSDVFSEDTYIGTNISIATQLLVLSTYFYGGVAWPKKSFLKTSGILILASVIVSIGVTITFKYILTNQVIMFHSTGKVIIWSIIAAEYLSALALIILTYYRLKTITLASSK